MAIPNGFIVPEDLLSVYKVTASQGTVAAADIQILVNNVVEETLSMSTFQQSFVTTLDLSEGDIITGYSVGIANLLDFTMSMFFESTAIPSPGISVGDVVDVTLSGKRASVLPLNEVIKVPDVQQDYWVFQADTGILTASSSPVSVVKRL